MEQEIKVRRVDFYPADWLEGTVALSHTERSVYITICAAIYAHGGPVDAAHVRCLCPGRGFNRAVDNLVKKGKVERTTDTGVTYLRQQRALYEVALATQRIHNARVNGELGGRPPNGLAEPAGSLDQNPTENPNTIFTTKDLKRKNSQKEKGEERRKASQAASNPSPSVNGHSGSLGPDEGRWRMRLGWYLDNPASWDGNWGPPPTDPRCWLIVDPASVAYAPLLDELGLRPPA